MLSLPHAFAAVGPQALHERAAVVTRGAHLEVVRPGLANPALVLRARRAEVAHHAPLAAGEEVLGVLAAQQRAPADVAGDIELVGANVAGPGHCVEGEGSNAQPPQ